MTVREPSRTRALLVEAALATLKEAGYSGTTARAIAARAGVNQALVFYHFGGVDGLLLEALDASSAERLERYRNALAETSTVKAIVAGAANQLVARRDVPSDLMSASVAPSRSAAGTPSRIVPRKMKVSPAVMLAEVLGMRMGRELERTTKLVSARNCKPCTGVNERHCESAHAQMSAPAETSASQ